MPASFEGKKKNPCTAKNKASAGYAGPDLPHHSGSLLGRTVEVKVNDFLMFLPFCAKRVDQTSEMTHEISRKLSHPNVDTTYVALWQQ